VTIKSVKQWGSTTEPPKSSQKFSVTLTVPYQVEVEAENLNQAAKRAKNMPLSQLEQVVTSKGKVDCPTLIGGNHEISRVILASEEQGVDK
jgi:hypothetical protein